MHLLTFKLLILGLVITLIFLYLHAIINNNKDKKAKLNEKFGIEDSTTPQPISIQLTNQIALKLGCSVRRIQNLSYTGDLTTQTLAVSFTILDPNIIELSNGEQNAQTVASSANNLFNQNAFIVKINNVNVKLNKLNQKQKQSGILGTLGTGDMSMYFNNYGLQDVANYSTQKYKQVPTDTELTKFFNLQLDKNFQVKPILE